MPASPSIEHQVFAKISAKRRRPWKGEEEVRLAWIGALEDALNVHFDAERAKKDGSINNVIIEFKAPGYFKGRKDSASFREATVVFKGDRARFVREFRRKKQTDTQMVPLVGRRRLGETTGMAGRVTCCGGGGCKKRLNG